MKTAVVYYSLNKNTEFAASEIAMALDADVIQIAPVKQYPAKGVRKFLWGGKGALMGDEPALLPYTFDAEKYDLVVICTPVWASSFAPPIKTFVKENRRALSKKKIAGVACYAGSGADRALEKLKDFMGIRAYEAKLTLIDPKDKPTQEKLAAIREFCVLLKNS